MARYIQLKRAWWMIWGVVFFSCFPVWAKVQPQQELDAPAPVGETALLAELQQNLDSILANKWVRQAVNGVYVVDVARDQVVYSLGSDRKLNPASNVKLVSTATALEALGGSFTYKTRILGPAPDAEGVVHGDVYLIGEMDPLLKPAHLAQLADALKQQGITRIQGKLVVGTDPQREAFPYPVVTVTVVGGAKAGERPQMFVAPKTDLFVIQNQARTFTASGKKARRLRSSVTAIVSTQMTSTGSRFAIKLTGRIRAFGRVTLTKKVPDPPLLTVAVLRGILTSAGISVTGSYGRADQPPAQGVETLAVYESPPLSELVAQVNKPSWNWLADRLITVVGGQLYGGSPSLHKGVRAMTEFLAKLGLYPGDYRLENGSGLSHQNRLSAKQIVHLLLSVFHDVRIGEDFVASLAVGGRDGTLRVRFAGQPAAGWVLGKTGTLRSVAALSGFVSAGGADRLCFAILTNGFRERYREIIRSAHVAMVNEMYFYLSKRHAELEGVHAFTDVARPLLPEGAPAESPEEQREGDSPHQDAPLLE